MTHDQGTSASDRNSSLHVGHLPRVQQSSGDRAYKREGSTHASQQQRARHTCFTTVRVVGWSES
eukprot:258237-Amphidinium_carterae.1